MISHVALLSLSILGFSISRPAIAQISVGSISGGTLVETGTQGQRLESATSGQFTITVGAGTPSATIQIAAPTFVSGDSTDPSGTTYTAIADVEGITITSGGAGDTTALAVGNSTVLVDMQVERPSQFPAGSYQYDVDLTITP